MNTDGLLEYITIPLTNGWSIREVPSSMSIIHCNNSIYWPSGEFKCTICKTEISKLDFRKYLLLFKIKFPDNHHVFASFVEKFLK